MSEVNVPEDFVTRAANRARELQGRIAALEAENARLNGDASWAATHRSELADLRQEFARAEQQNAELEAQVELLTAPVSHAEAVAILGKSQEGRGDYTFKIAAAGFCNALISARAAEPKESNDCVVAFGGHFAIARSETTGTEMRIPITCEYVNKIVAALESSNATLMQESEEVRDQLRRIIQADSDRDARLRGKTVWHPMLHSDRPNCLAWREVEGGRELLMYNNALCDPIYIVFQPAAEPNVEPPIDHRPPELRRMIDQVYCTRCGSLLGFDGTCPHGACAMIDTAHSEGSEDQLKS